MQTQTCNKIPTRVFYAVDADFDIASVTEHVLATCAHSAVICCVVYVLPLVVVGLIHDPNTGNYLIRKMISYLINR